MNRKIILISLTCIFMITISLGAVIVKADGTSYYTTGRIAYSNGNAIGTYLHFNIDENTGEVTDYTVKLTIYTGINNYSFYGGGNSFIGTGLEYYSMINDSYENVTIFNSIKVNGFEPASEPNAFADYLALQGENTLMIFYDRDGGNAHYANSGKNTKITFKVLDEFEITRFNYPDYPFVEVPITGVDENGNLIISEQQNVSDEQSAWQEISIKSNNTVTTMTVHYGDVTINGQTIDVNLSAYGYLDIYTWAEAPREVNEFWYNDLKIDDETGRKLIEDAKNTGIIPAEGWIQKIDADFQQVELPPNAEITNTATSNIYSNYYTYDDPTFNINFNNIDENGVDVIVDSQISTGRIVIINVDKTLLQATSVEELLVKMDNSQIKHANTLEDLMVKAENKDINASYYAISGEQLTTVFVYVPHFSAHTISIKSISSTIATISNVLLPIILSILFVVLSIGGLILQKRKQRDDY